MQNLEEVLVDKFGLESFREGQKEVVESVVGLNDTLVFMPTGGWKSLTYQLPGVVLEGVTIVISPLISLMKDQVDKLNELWIKTRLINSTISPVEIQDILNDLLESKTNPIKFLYIAPERLHSSKFLNVIKQVKIAQVAIDEAHCISQWWHDFRPSYMKILGFLNDLKNPPILNPFPPREKGELGNSSFVEKKLDYIVDLARDLRKKWTKEEELMWELLRKKQLNWLRFRRQHPFWRYIADFYCDELKLVIELDWKIHENQIEYDNIRTEIIKKYWVQVIRIKNEEIYNDIQNILNKILSPLGGKYPKGDRGISFPIVALTATATKKVRADIIDKLWLIKYNLFISWFDRKNIIILVREISAKNDKLEKVLEILNNTAWDWIIYCSSRKAVKEVYDFLQENNISVWMYTWELSADIRENMQNKFMNSEYKAIVATNAFWMWIDKKDIRFVIHYNLPWSIENYYQEVWRAGRDWKQSFWIVLASYQDTKIQEFFIENIYPTKEEVLKFYDYIFKGIPAWNWKWDVIIKTYFTMSKESGIWNDMKVWSIVKILEKYWIIKRWINNREEVDNFRWRWLTLIQEKRKHSQLLIDWDRQSKLEEEAYYKLDQIKKLLFYPSCRKRFILEYFWDEEDLKNLWDNCGVCDFCIEKKKILSWKVENLVSLSVFEIVLDVMKQFDNKFWVKLITNFLRWSKEKRILDWWYDKKEDYWILSDYSSELIEALIEALIREEFLERSSWKFPLIWLTDLWIISLKNEKILKESEEDLQSYLHLKVRSNAFKKKPTKKEEKNIEKKSWNYDLTLKLFREWLSLKDIAKKVDFKLMTIENHILKLYEKWDLTLNDILKLVEFDNLKQVKNTLNEYFWENIDKLKPIKEKLEEWWFKNISYFEIKITILMIIKKDL